MRVNAGSEADLEATVEPARSPACVSPRSSTRGDRCRPRGVRVHALIESPAGVEAAYEIARHPAFTASRSARPTSGRRPGRSSGLDWPRGRIVNAAVAAGLPRPPQSVYPHVRDLDGLAESCRRGRELGHLGRAAIHPDQLAVIERGTCRPRGGRAGPRHARPADDTASGRLATATSSTPRCSARRARSSRSPSGTADREPLDGRELPVGQALAAVDVEEVEPRRIDSQVNLEPDAPSRPG